MIASKDKNSKDKKVKHVENYPVGMYNNLKERSLKTIEVMASWCFALRHTSPNITERLNTVLNLFFRYILIIIYFR